MLVTFLWLNHEIYGNLSNSPQTTPRRRCGLTKNMTGRRARRRDTFRDVVQIAVCPVVSSALMQYADFCNWKMISARGRSAILL